MKESFASWMRGVNVNAAALLLAALTFAATMVGFGLMLRAELSAFRAEIKADNAEFKAEIRADNAAFKTEVRADLDDMRADIAEFKAEVRVELDEIRAENQTLGEKIDAIAYILDTRLDGIEREQARLQGVISVLQEAVGVAARSVEDP